MLLVCGLASYAQDVSPSEASGTAGVNLPDAPSAEKADVPIEEQPHKPVTIASLPKHVAIDELHIFASPVYIRKKDLVWLLPMAGATVVSLNTDEFTMNNVVSKNASFNQTAINVSDGLRDGFLVAPVMLYAVGKVRKDERQRQAGLVGAESIIDAYLFGDIVKLCSWRERPNVDNGRGEFFIGKAGTNSSFISGHSLVAWSSAAALADQSHSKWKQATYYTLATGVSLTRVMGQQHFPTDVLLGGATGWLIGHYVSRAHKHVK